MEDARGQVARDDARPGGRRPGRRRPRSVSPGTRRATKEYADRWVRRMRRSGCVRAGARLLEPERRVGKRARGVALHAVGGEVAGRTRPAPKSGGSRLGKLTGPYWKAARDVAGAERQAACRRASWAGVVQPVVQPWEGLDLVVVGLVRLVTHRARAVGELHGRDQAGGGHQRAGIGTGGARNVQVDVVEGRERGARRAVVVCYVKVDDGRPRRPFAVRHPGIWTT